MANNKREKLEARANELGLTFVASTTDDELADLIADFENPDREKPTPEKSSVFKYYKTIIAGLSVHLSSDEERDEQPETVRFEAFEYWNEEKGEHYSLGLLKTSDTEVIEILQDDSNVVSITKKQYEELLESGKPAKI